MGYRHCLLWFTGWLFTGCLRAVYGLFTGYLFVPPVLPDVRVFQDVLVARVALLLGREQLSVSVSTPASEYSSVWCSEHPRRL